MGVLRLTVYFTVRVYLTFHFKLFTFNAEDASARVVINKVLNLVPMRFMGIMGVLRCFGLRLVILMQTVVIAYSITFRRQCSWD